MRNQSVYGVIPNSSTHACKAQRLLAKAKPQPTERKPKRRFRPFAADPARICFSPALHPLICCRTVGESACVRLDDRCHGVRSLGYSRSALSIIAAPRTHTVGGCVGADDDGGISWNVQDAGYSHSPSFTPSCRGRGEFRG